MNPVLLYHKIPFEPIEPRGQREHRPRRSRLAIPVSLLGGLRKSLFLSALYLLFLPAWNFSAQAQPRQTINFNKGWKFFLGDDSLASNLQYDDSKWRALDLPHDWSIESDFSKDAAATNQGGALPGGIGWYRKTFVLPGNTNEKMVRVEFDGVYKNSEVWVNGHYLGKRPNGYISFYYDLTPHLAGPPAKNVIAVKVDNSQQPDSRWYTGSGIYRDTRLVITRKIAFEKWGTFIHTPEVSGGRALIMARSKIGNASLKNTAIELRMDIFDPSGRLVSRSNSSGVDTASGDFLFKAEVLQPKLWSVDQPNLYKAVFKVFLAAVLMDQWETRFGIRSFQFDAQTGFYLNDQPLKIKGVCMHHDLGALGAAFHRAAAKRQLVLLKEMGCNAIRTAHNPPAPAFLDLCDEMGFLVMDEAFDIWRKQKNKFDYHLHFREWHAQDLADMVKRDRNHPSVFMWSIGNEIREQFDSTGIAITKELVQIVKSVDSTRPVTCALTENQPEKNFIYKSGALDVLGFNYKIFDYGSLPARFPGEKILATETASALATRGAYDLPSDSMRLWPPDSKQPFTGGNPDMTVSSYDHVYAYWGASHEKSWLAVKNNPYMAGCFVWSGFDFLGEPLPYPWPARSSYYGIIDLAGFPKDVYYMYQSEWTDKPVLHLFPHWNWARGDSVDVWAYYNNADEVELFLNGRSLGRRSKTDTSLHVSWRVAFQPGTLKAVSRKSGRKVLERRISTAGPATRILLEREPAGRGNDGLQFVKVRVVDKNGETVPTADHPVKFSVSGPAGILGTDNGFQADTVSLKSRTRNCWKGRALVILRTRQKQGNITLKADSAGLLPGVLVLKTND